MAMTVPEGDINPYRVSEELTEHAGAGDDSISLGDSLRVGISEIMCSAERVELPAVCIRTGATEDLLRRSRTWPEVRRGAAFVFGILSLSLWAGRSEVAELISWLGVSGTLIAATLFGIIVVVSARTTRPAKPFRLTVSWFVSREYVRRCRWLTLILRTVMITAAGLFGLVANKAEALAFMVLVASFIAYLLNTEGRLHVIRVRGKDAFLTGHSRDFHASLKRLYGFIAFPPTD
ncbi:MAG: hypothetical protein R3C19_01010 [Planctomycetaceae bacterium]